MIKNIKFVVFFIFISFFYHATSNSEALKIAYVDIDKIISESKVGKKIHKKIESSIAKINKELEKDEKKLKTQEEEILKQKNIISKEEIDKKINKLKIDINTYRNKKNDFNSKISQKRLSATSEIVVYLNKILGKYAAENSISLIIQKKNIVIGVAEMDITDPILKIFDKEIKDVKLN